MRSIRGAPAGQAGRARLYARLSGREVRTDIRGTAQHVNTARYRIDPIDVQYNIDPFDA